MDLYRYTAAFPELVIPVLGHLKKFAKLTKVGGSWSINRALQFHSIFCVITLALLLRRCPI